MSSPEDRNRVVFGNTEAWIPADVAFNYKPGVSLAIDLSTGCKGILHLRIVPGSKDRPSPEIPIMEGIEGNACTREQTLPKIVSDSQGCQSLPVVSWFNQPQRPTQDSSGHNTDEPEDPKAHETTSAEKKDNTPEARVGIQTSEAQTTTDYKPFAETDLEQTAAHRQEAAVMHHHPAASAKPSQDLLNALQHKDGNTVLPSAKEPEQSRPVKSMSQDEEDAQAAVEAQPSSSNEPRQRDIGTDNQDTVEEGNNKENTPRTSTGNTAKTPAPGSKGKKDSKRKSGTRSSHPSTGKRSGKKQKAVMAQESSSMSFQWRAVSATGENGLPEERWGATLTAASSNQAWLFGGNSAEGQLGDVWAVDLAKQQWSKLSDHPDQVRAWHQANFVASEQGEHLYAFGGERVTVGPVASGANEDDDLECLSDVSQYDPEAKLWMQLPISGAQLQRAGHSTTLLPDGRIMSFGGIDADGKHRNDAHIIDLQHLNCFSLSGIIRGAPPKPRAYHSATLVGTNIVVLGGDGARVWSLKEVYSLSIETWNWKEHTADVEGDAPSPRSGHSAVALPGDRYLLVFGGGIPAQNTFFGGVSMLDTWTWTWSSPTITGVERPRGRSGQGMALVGISDGQHVVALHGGRTHEERLCKDMWILERLS